MDGFDRVSYVPTTITEMVAKGIGDPLFRIFECLDEPDQKDAERKIEGMLVDRVSNMDADKLKGLQKRVAECKGQKIIKMVVHPSSFNTGRAIGKRTGSAHRPGPRTELVKCYSNVHAAARGLCKWNRDNAEQGRKRAQALHLLFTEFSITQCEATIREALSRKQKSRFYRAVPFNHVYVDCQEVYVDA